MSRRTLTEEQWERMRDIFLVGKGCAGVTE